MLDKMGLKVNKEEAEMLIMSIDENGDNRVTMNEFLDLVFTHNDGISNLNLGGSEVTHKLLIKVIGAEAKAQLMQEIKRNAERQQKLRPMNQWKLFLQKNLNNIALDLLTVDSER
jgi:EF-hand domain pair